MNIKNQWDKIAEERLIHRMNGDDISYNLVFLPTVKKYLSQFNGSNVLDFGCGTGELTFEIAKLGFEVLGVDISKHSIEVARKYFTNKNLKFLNASLIDTKFESNFSVVIANMALMDTKNLLENLQAINKSLVSKGKLFVTITHPAFWPIYWEYALEDGFDYLKECSIYRTYKTKTKVFDGFKTTHFHRPISLYIENFKSASFNLLNIDELRNPNDKEWYPRFMQFELEKI